MESPYKGLVPYAEEDFEYFFGRETEQRVISANLRASRLTLLYGESGVGKSSLLNAGVAHGLRKDPDYAVVVFDSWQLHPAEGLHLAVANEIPELGRILHELSYPSLAEAVPRWIDGLNADNGRTLLIILDQFEDFIEYHRDDSDYGLANIIVTEDLPIHFLVSIREDSLAGLDRFKSSIPGLFNNYLRVEHLSVPGAKDAILKPLRNFNKLHPDRAIEMTDEKLSDTVVKQVCDAEGERVQAALLQLVMTRWWERESEKKSTEMQEETLVELGKPANIVAAYLDEALARLSMEDDTSTEICFHLFDKLLTSKGRRLVQTFDELTEGTDYRNDRVATLLENLVRARILTRVPPPKGVRSGELSFAFVHDLIAKAATLSLQGYKQEQKLDRAESEAAEAKDRAEKLERLQQEFEKMQRMKIEEAQRMISNPARRDAEERKARVPAEKKQRLPTDPAVARLELAVAEIAELKEAFRGIVWERSAILGPPRESHDRPDIFVLMPITSELRPVYDNHIKKVATQLGMRVSRADDFFTTGSIMRDLWSAIHDARIVIADCTGRNPNVFYEIGLAHAIGRHTILISQFLDDIPFDLRHLRVIVYEYTPPGMKAFEKALIETISKSM